jgi:hypothetical protein
MADTKTATDGVGIVLSVAGTLASIGITVLIYWLTKRGSKKRMSYEFDSAEITQGGTGFSGLELMYKGRSVYGASIVTVTIKNPGGVPISKEDFEGPLRIEFTGGIVDEELLAQHISRVMPPDLPVKSRLVSDGRSGEPVILIEPLLLNAGDKFSIKVLVSEFARELKVTGRISGISRIEKHLQGKSRAMGLVSLVSAATVMIANLAALNGLHLIQVSNKPYGVSSVLTIVTAIMALIATIAASFSQRTSAKKRSRQK